jgi:hypothetical protein
MAFKNGHPKYGGRQKGGSRAQIELKAAILGALEAVVGQGYLERMARKDPRTPGPRSALVTTARR